MKTKTTIELLSEQIASGMKLGSLNEAVDSVTKFAVVLSGGSIGEKNIRNVRDLTGIKVPDGENIFEEYADAQAKMKRMNKLLTPGEKKYYKLRYIVAASKDSVFTGKNK